MTQVRFIALRRIVPVLMLPVLAACAGAPRPIGELPPPAPATYFTADAHAGDSVKDLAQRYRVKEEDLVAMNAFRDRKAVAGTVRIPAYGLRDVEREPALAPARVAKTDAAPRANAPRPAPRTQVVTRELAPPQAGGTSKATPNASPNTAPNTTTAESSWFGQWFSSEQETAAMPAQKFLWPVKGQVISGFGQSATGQRNDGINISAPRGTPVLAADAGTVTYVGNELKGYGNLVLIRHDNGYITAYAHSERVTVERGARVARGQIIAYAGETGDVNQPQVHFEVRLGTRPVDPQPYLVAAK